MKENAAESGIYAVADRILKDLLVVALSSSTHAEDARVALCAHLERFREECVIRAAQAARPEPTPVRKTFPPVNERDAAIYIGMSVAFLRKSRMEGHGPAFLRIARSIRYRIPDLDEWLATARVPR